MELAQIVIPGRDPSLGDVLFNTLGAAAGQFLFLTGGPWILPAARVAGRLSAVAALLAAGVVALTGYLLAPSYPRLPYFAWWTAARPELVWYRGRVLDARLGPLSLHPTDRPLPPQVQSLLVLGAPISIEALAGPRTRSLGPLLVVEDRWRRDILLVGPDRGDLVLRYRARSARFGLDGPDLRLRGALEAVQPDDTLHITIQWRSDGYCLSANRISNCHLWFTAGIGWAVLLYPKHFPIWAQHLLDFGWIAGLLAPVGLWLRRRPESGLALGVIVGSLWLLPSLVGLNATATREWMGAACGLVIGVALQAVARRSPKARET